MERPGWSSGRIKKLLHRKLCHPTHFLKGRDENAVKSGLSDAKIA
jgi:hypothetical protein